jgi:KUP system potassium uptake protein
MVCCIALVLIFRSSNRLAAAMGISVTGTMIITTVLIGLVARRIWGWSRRIVWPLVGTIFTIEAVFLSANLFKIPRGGWFTVAIATAVFVLMTTWQRGRAFTREEARSSRISLSVLSERLTANNLPGLSRADGEAVFLSTELGLAPPALLVQLRTARTLPSRLYVVTAVTRDEATVLPARRIECVDHGHGLTEVTLNYGFTEQNSVARDLELHLDVRPEMTYYYVDTKTIRAIGRKNMAQWRERLYAFMKRNESGVAVNFGLPADRIIEISEHIEI